MNFWHSFFLLTGNFSRHRWRHLCVSWQTEWRMSRKLRQNDFAKKGNFKIKNFAENFISRRNETFAKKFPKRLRKKMLRTKFFYSNQGCQIFLGTTYQNRKKYAKLP
jgi:hypothetical protein